MMKSVTDMALPEHVDALCPELAAVLRDAVAAGNEAVESWQGYGQAVRLKGPAPVLVDIEDSIRDKLTYRSVDDPHYWLGEIHCRIHADWFIALSFGTDPREVSPAASLPRIKGFH